MNPKGVPDKLKQRVEEQIAMGATYKRKSKGSAWVAAAVLLFLATVLFVQREPILSFLKQEPKLEPFDGKTERSLKVQWFDGPSFMSYYGDAFIIQHPNMDVETVNSPPYDPQKDRAVQFEEMIEKDKPDLVYVTLDIYRKLAAEGKLLALDSFVAKEKYDLSGFRDGIVETIREAGGGTLYGLTPTFSSNALYYNKTLFDKYGVSYPTDKTSWADVFRLAQRFPSEGEGDNRIYGLVPDLSSPYGAAEAAARTSGLGLTDAGGAKMTVNTSAWRSIWEFVADGVKKGWLYEAKPRTGSISGIDFYKRNPFLTGNAAMMVSNQSLAEDLLEGKRRYNLADFTWDIVTEPVDPARPNVSSSLRFDGIYAIPAQSLNERDAWELLKLIHSEPIAKKMSNRMGMSSRKPAANETAAYRSDAFGALKPDPDNVAGMGSIITGALYQGMSGLVNSEIKAAAAGAKTLDAAIESIQQGGQQLLDQAKAANKP
ncbi:extracellular solute-binding protein [Paenibacillus ginsengarvi]|uniref:extracellular solute-binding protein n=1 Tax=Paenibacillus ginsengarvi TaxID=400777 RepID=UPI00187443CE|nr:extracellular solute-binding protein [Paenibacillus ginsengarvi]